MREHLLRPKARRAMDPEELLELGSYFIERNLAALIVRLEWTKKATRKIPVAAPSGYQSATTDPDAFGLMLADALALRDAVLGIGVVPATGGFTFLDFDTKNGAGGAVTLERFLGHYVDAFRTRYRSISGALNGIVRRPDDYPDLSNAAPKGWHGFEVRDARGYAVPPGVFTPWGAWSLDEGSLELDDAWPMPLELARRFRKAGESGVRVAPSPEVERYVAARTSYTPASRRFAEEILDRFEREAENGRHPAMLRATAQLVGLEYVDLGDALGRLQASWDERTTGEGREREVGDALGWIVARQAERDAGSHGSGINWDTPSSRREGAEVPQVPAEELEEAPLIDVLLSDVVPREIEWIWTGRIPRGCLTLLDGDPSIGKSTLALDLIARVSRGGLLPPKNLPESAPRGMCLLLSAEDDLEATIQPRLVEANADLENVRAIMGVRVSEEGEEERGRGLVLPRDLHKIEAKILERRAVLVVVDVLASYTSIKGDVYRDSDIRSELLAPLAAAAARTSSAIVLLRHLTKSHGGNALYAGGGSIAITGAARSVLLAGAHPSEEGVSVLAVSKANLSAKPSALAYRIRAKPGGHARVEWIGEVEHVAGDLLRERSQGRPDDEFRAQLELVRGYLAERGGPVLSTEFAAWAKLVGISTRTLERIRARLGVHAIKRGGEHGARSYWTVELPAG